MPATSSVPSRPAPPPPASVKLQKPVSLPQPAPRSLKSGMSKLRSVSLVGLAATKSTDNLAAKKKPPPPRPPPPKQQVSAINFQPVFASKTSNNHQQSADLLIDWSTPPGSPLPGRSTSDGVSLRSFGSDCSSGIGSNKTGSGMAHSESGFESESDNSVEAGSFVSMPKPVSMPTIIRPNRSKPNLTRPDSNTSFPEASAPSPLLQDLLTIDFSIPPTVLQERALFDLGSDDWNISDNSPPEPSIPPPSLPSEFKDYENTETAESPVNKKKAIALYTYESSEPGDLNFKEGEEVTVFRQVNTEWSYGVCSGREGIFPSNFVKPVDSYETGLDDVPYRAIVKFAFTAETADDLNLKEGDIVQVTRCHGNGWLFGFIGNRQGQFPESFVEQIS